MKKILFSITSLLLLILAVFAGITSAKFYKEFDLGTVNASFSYTIPVTLLTGSELNTIIASDSPTSIIFDYTENYASVVSGYTGTDVSADQDEGALYYYVDGTAYILADGEICLNANSASLFYGLTTLVSVEFNNINTSDVTSFSNFFYSCKALSSITGLDNFDTSNVTNMSYMFYYCSTLTDLSGVEEWDTSNVTTLTYMFYYCKGLTDISPISDWDISSVTTVSRMFYYCNSLTEIDLSNWTFASVTTATYLFTYCTSATVIDISGWDMSNVSSVSIGYMFRYDSKLTTIYAGSGWDPDKISGSYVFSSCTSLVGGNGTAYSSSYVTYTRARIDTDDATGYFTEKTSEASASSSDDDSGVSASSLEIGEDDVSVSSLDVDEEEIDEDDDIQDNPLIVVEDSFDETDKSDNTSDETTDTSTESETSNSSSTSDESGVSGQESLTSDDVIIIDDDDDSEDEDSDDVIIVVDDSQTDDDENSSDTDTVDLPVITLAEDSSEITIEVDDNGEYYIVIEQNARICISGDFTVTFSPEDAIVSYADGSVSITDECVIEINDDIVINVVIYSE